MSDGHWNEEGFWEFGSNLETREATPKPVLVIKLNNTASNDPCELCGQRTDPETGPELFRCGLVGAGVFPVRRRVRTGSGGMPPTLSGLGAGKSVKGG